MGRIDFRLFRNLFREHISVPDSLFESPVSGSCKSLAARIVTGFLRGPTNNKKGTDPTAHMSAKSVPSAPSGARTLDTLIKSQVLYQLS